MRLPDPKDDPTWACLRAHDVEELWDPAQSPHIAATYQARMQLLTDLVVGLAGPGGRVLDVGCAQGTLGLTLAERGLRVTLLDVRHESLEYARSRHETGEVTFCVGVLGPDMPPANDFDVVMCTEVLEHVPAPAQFLLQLRSKVRAGGALCLTTPNGDYLMAHLPTYGGAPQSTIDEAEPNSMDGGAHRYLYTREELIALVRGAGMRLEQHGFFSPAWLEGHLKTRQLHRLHYRWRKQLLRVPARLPERLGRRFCASQFLVARA